MQELELRLEASASDASKALRAAVPDGVSVYRTRLRMGEKLARNILKAHAPQPSSPQRTTARPPSETSSACISASGTKFLPIDMFLCSLRAFPLRSHTPGGGRSPCRTTRLGEERSIERNVSLGLDTLLS